MDDDTWDCGVWRKGVVWVKGVWEEGGWEGREEGGGGCGGVCVVECGEGGEGWGMGG